MTGEREAYRKSEYDAFRQGSVYVQRATVEGEFRQHTHDFAEIVLILAGSGEHLVGRQAYPLRRGDVFVIKGDTRHGFCRAQGLEMVNLMYDPRMLLAQGEGLQSIPGFDYLFLVQPEILGRTPYPYTVFLEGEEVETAACLCQFLLRRLDEGGEDGGAMRYGFLTLAAYLAGHARLPGELSERVQIFAAAVRYFQEHYTQPVTLEQAAGAVSVSGRHLERVFAQVCGVSPMAYFTDLRLGHAALLLRSTSKPIAQIAEESGFADPAYFTRAFRKKYGASPRQSRRGLPAPE